MYPVDIEPALFLCDWTDNITPASVKNTGFPVDGKAKEPLGCFYHPVYAIWMEPAPPQRSSRLPLPIFLKRRQSSKPGKRYARSRTRRYIRGRLAPLFRYYILVSGKPQADPNCGTRLWFNL